MKTANELKCRITETWEEGGKEAKDLVAVFDDIQDAMVAMHRISRTRPDSTFEKLRMYKTAWSPVWNCFVGILRVYTDENGAPILLCKLAHTSQIHVFRASELTKYVL